MRTNKELLSKGIKQMLTTLFFFFLGPIVVNSAFKNQEHSWYYVILSIGILCCVFGIFNAFRGLKTIMRALFND